MAIPLLQQSQIQGENLVLQVNFGGKRGFLCYTPQDDDGTGATTVRTKRVLITPQGINGAYVATESVPLIGSQFGSAEDWRGPLPTDILVYSGSKTRSAMNIAAGTPHFRSRGAKIFKQGLLYAEVPDVNGDAVEQPMLVSTSSGARFLVVITVRFSLLEGAHGNGFGIWRVWARPEGRNASKELFQPIDNPLGWKLWGEFDGPDDFNGLRYAWAGQWRGNESGTEATCLCPVNALGSDLPHDLRNLPVSGPGACFLPVPAGFGSCVNRDFVQDEGVFSFHQFKIVIDPDSESAALVDEGVQPNKVTDTFTIGGSCVFAGEFPMTDASWNITRSSTWSGVTKAAVDYQGDTRVFATLEFTGGSSTTDTGGIGTSVSSTVSESQNQNSQLVLPGGARIDTRPQGNFSRNSNASGPAAGPLTGTTSLSGRRGISGFLVGDLGSAAVTFSFLDLRIDSAIVNRTGFRSPTASAAGSGTQGGLGCGGCSVPMTYTTAPNNDRHVVTEVWVDGAMVNEFDEIIPGGGGGPSSGVQCLFLASGSGCCPTNQTIVTDNSSSLEQMAPRIDGFSSQFQNFRPGTIRFDHFGNVMYSVRTLKGFTNSTIPSPILTGDSVLRDLPGDDLVDKLNEIDYTPQAPLSTETGHVGHQVEVL